MTEEYTKPPRAGCDMKAFIDTVQKYCEQHGVRTADATHMEILI